mmetsp:Transcript_35290/g.36681  ORF Transcript_35290/g.36681 Transcript_35290/m.36681 type:complete len:504 (-) Transcript_35290:22-1533(-)
MKGKEIYLRKNPLVYLSEEKLESSTVQMNEFPVLIAVADITGVVLKNPERVVKMSIQQNEINLASYGIKLKEEKGHPKCKLDYFPEKHIPWIEEEINNTPSTICTYIPGLYIKNNYSASDSAFTSITFDRCDPEKDDCHENLDQIYKGFFISIRYANTYINNNDYKNPLVYYKDVITIRVQGSLFRRVNFSLTQDIINTDQGWLLENYHEINYLGISDIYYEYSFAATERILNITFDSPLIRKKTTRSYMKVQELMAKIGGFFEGLYLLMFVLVNHYVNYKYNFFLIETLSTRQEKQSHHFIQNNNKKAPCVEAHNIQNKNIDGQGSVNVLVGSNEADSVSNNNKLILEQNMGLSKIIERNMQSLGDNQIVNKNMSDFNNRSNSSNHDHNPINNSQSICELLHHKELSKIQPQFKEIASEKKEELEDENNKNNQIVERIIDGQKKDSDTSNFNHLMKLRKEDLPSNYLSYLIQVYFKKEKTIISRIDQAKRSISFTEFLIKQD